MIWLLLAYVLGVAVSAVTGMRAPWKPAQEDFLWPLYVIVWAWKRGKP